MTEYEKYAMNFFCDCYLNTGCEEDEAIAFTEGMFQQVGYDADKLLIEAIRYQDM